MPPSPTDSTSGATRDRVATEAAATEAGRTADATAGTAPSGPSPSGAKSKATDPACPTCRGPLERYLGDAAHKLGSFWCYACGVRHRLPASVATDETTASAGTSGTKAAG